MRLQSPAVPGVIIAPPVNSGRITSKLEVKCCYRIIEGRPPLEQVVVARGRSKGVENRSVQFSLHLEGLLTDSTRRPSTLGGRLLLPNSRSLLEALPIKASDYSGVIKRDMNPKERLRSGVAPGVAIR